MNIAASLRPTSRYLKNKGVLQHCQVWKGKGPDLLLIPGITMPAPMWGFVAERLASFSCVHVMDVRGRGLSDHTPGLSYKLADLAEDALAAAAALDNPILVGHSMGARIAVAAAAAGGGNFSRLIAVDPPVSGPGRRPYPSPLDWYIDAIREVSEGGGLEAARRAVPHWPEEQIELRATWLPTCSEEAVTQTYRSFHEESLHDLLPLVRCPTLLLYAGLGGVITDEDAAEFVGLLPDGKAVKVDRAGHMIPWDRFDIFVAEVKAFALSKTAASQAAAR